MEIRVYFRKKSVVNRLVREKIIEEGKEDEKLYGYNTGGIYSEDYDHSLVYFKVNTLFGLELPQVVKGLKVTKVTLHDILLLEQNTHIQQGEGTFGNGTKYETTYTDDDFELPSASEYSNAKGYRAVIHIWVKGVNAQSVADCYKKIREGELSGNWKGIPVVPIHCKGYNAPAKIDDLDFMG